MAEGLSVLRDSEETEITSGGETAVLCLDISTEPRWNSRSYF